MGGRGWRIDYMAGGDFFVRLTSPDGEVFTATDRDSLANARNDVCRRAGHPAPAPGEHVCVCGATRVRRVNRCMATEGDHHEGDAEVPCERAGTFVVPFSLVQRHDVYVCVQHYPVLATMRKAEG